MKKINLLLIIIFYFGCENNPILFIDCNGIENGLSMEDECGICDENPTNNCIQDCDGNWGGPDGIPENGDEITIDDCGICGGNGKLDCNNNCILPDEYGNYISEEHEFDCFGICGGGAVPDDCNICNGPGAVYDCGCPGILRDCADECNGPAVEDCNGTCNGTAEKDCIGDCNGTAVVDCAGVCNGNAYEDECGICDQISLNDCTQDCLGNWGGTAVIDECDVCSGDGSTCSGDDGSVGITDGCELPENTVHLIANGNVLYNIPDDIGGYQFNVNGTTASGASGGESASAGFTVSAGGSTVLAFSFTGAIISSDCGVLTTLSLVGVASGLSNIIFSMGGGTGTIPIKNYQP